MAKDPKFTFFGYFLQLDGSTCDTLDTLLAYIATIFIGTPNGATKLEELGQRGPFTTFGRNKKAQYQAIKILTPADLR